jgi:hypothetical protein
MTTVDRLIHYSSALLISAGFVFGGGLPKASITVRVTESESLAPVAGAKARIEFTISDGHGGIRSLQRAGVTDAKGQFSATENTLFYIAADAQKSGYYRTSASLDLRPTLNDTYGTPAVISVILKRIGQPTPMYARKRARLEIPIVNKPVGFDLMSFDWLPPYGGGTVADFVFTLTQNISDKLSKTLTLKFSNADDGILPIDVDAKEGSALRLPRMAPEAGYESQWIREVGAHYAPKEGRSYFYRIRTIRDGPRIRSALYGKIHGDIAIDTINSKTALIFLNYYLNPDGTRNVEFDPNKNLFNDLPVMEQVRDP